MRTVFALLLVLCSCSEILSFSITRGLMAIPALRSCRTGLRSGRTCAQTYGRRATTMMATKQTFKNFDDMLQNSNKPVLVDFYAVWCGPCVMMSRELAALGEELGDKVAIVKIDTDKYPNIATRFQIAALPTCVLFKDGMPVDRIEGVVQAKQLKERIESKL